MSEPQTIVLDLPAPPSVNRTRRVDWAFGPKYKGWTRAADNLVLAARGRSVNPQPRSIKGRVSVEITLSDHHVNIDPDNAIKALLDFLRRIEVIEDDGPKHMRELIVRWGVAPEGIRVTVREFKDG